jgi:hypothetical protein
MKDAVEASTKEKRLTVGAASTQTVSHFFIRA